MVESEPDLAVRIRRVRGGYLKIQGTWMPYEVRLSRCSGSILRYLPRTGRSQTFSQVHTSTFFRFSASNAEGWQGLRGTSVMTLFLCLGTSVVLPSLPVGLKPSQQTNFPRHLYRP